MPISRQECDEGRPNIDIPLMQYLDVRQDEAFSAEEILMALIDVYGRRTTIAEVAQSLRKLVNAGRLESKEMAGHQMYTIMSK